MPIILGVGRETSRDWGMVTALPVGAAVGDLFTYKAAATVFWRFVYTGEETYPWACIGGPPIRVSDFNLRTTTSTTYTTLTGSPEFVLPFGGDYDVAVASLCSMSGGTGYNGHSASWTANDNDAIITSSGSTITLERTSRKTGATAGSTAVVKNRVSAGTGSFDSRILRVQPVRVG